MGGVTVEKEYRYDAERELSDALDKRRGWVQFAYDPAGRVLSALHEATGREERFRYDAAGNHGRDDEPREYGPGGRLLRCGAITYAWDEAGRLREKREGAKLWQYTWDAAGRLAGVEVPDGRRAAYAYDPLGRRVEARLLAGRKVEERTRFVWDGDLLAHAIRTRATASADPVVEERTYCFEDGGFVPWAHCEAGPDGYGGRQKSWAFYVNDAIGTPEELIDGAGGVLAELDREVWGTTVAAEGARASTPLRFQGQQEDGETGLSYNPQQSAFTAVKKGQRPHTMAEHDQIASEALLAGNVPPDEAAALVAQSKQNLLNQGVTAPTRIPWKR